MRLEGSQGQPAGKQACTGMPVEVSQGEGHMTWRRPNVPPGRADHQQEGPESPRLARAAEGKPSQMPLIINRFTHTNGVLS